MRLQILSDLHLEFAPFHLPAVAADVLVLAGDIGVGDAGLRWVLETCRETPVIYVLGNHEFYHHTIPNVTHELREMAEGTNVHVLENDSVQIGDVIFLGAAPRSYPQPISSDPVSWPQDHLGVVVSLQQVAIVLATGAVLLILHLIVSRTRIGKAMRAVSEDRQAAQLMGINIDRVISFTFALGSAIAAVGGVFYGIYCRQADPLMGLMPGIKAFVAAVLGGIGSIPGAMLGGLLVGLVETGVSSVTWHITSTVTLTGSTLRDGVAFAVLILVLLVRPTGLLGRVGREKV